MDVFYPFDAVGMDNQEIRHGYFLRYILDPALPSYEAAMKSLIIERLGGDTRFCLIYLAGLCETHVKRALEQST